MQRRPYTQLDVAAMIAALEAVPMTRAAIARECGLSRTAVTLLANGDRGRCPEYRTVIALQQLTAKRCAVRGL